MQRETDTTKTPRKIRSQQGQFILQRKKVQKLIALVSILKCSEDAGSSYS